MDADRERIERAAAVLAGTSPVYVLHLASRHGAEPQRLHDRALLLVDQDAAIGDAEEARAVALDVSALLGGQRFDHLAVEVLEVVVEGRALERLPQAARARERVRLLPRDGHVDERSATHLHARPPFAVVVIGVVDRVTRVLEGSEVTPDRVVGDAELRHQLSKGDGKTFAAQEVEESDAPGRHRILATLVRHTSICRPPLRSAGELISCEV